jgi:hypothetical protein
MKLLIWKIVTVYLQNSIFGRFVQCPCGCLEVYAEDELNKRLICCPVCDRYLRVVYRENDEDGLKRLRI